MKLQAGLARVFAGQMSRIERYGLVNGLPGFISIEQDGILQTTALVIEDGKSRGIYVVRNPDKLRHLKGASLHKVFFRPGMCWWGWTVPRVQAFRSGGVSES